MPFDKCSFTQVLPHIYTGFDQQEFENALAEGGAVYLYALRDMIIATLWFIFTFVVLFIFMSVVGIILMIIMEKLALVRVNRAYIIDEVQFNKLMEADKQL